MAEKRGWTGKSIYDFNPSAFLEVLINDKWFRVTCEDFRSFDGSRRITQRVNGEKICSEYNGIVYFHRTNEQATPTNSNTVLYISDKKTSTQKLKNRDMKRGKLEEDYYI
jgi:hypothetical protein